VHRHTKWLSCSLWAGSRVTAEPPGLPHPTLPSTLAGELTSGQADMKEGVYWGEEGKTREEGETR